MRTVGLKSRYCKVTSVHVTEVVGPTGESVNMLEFSTETPGGRKGTISRTYQLSREEVQRFQDAFADFDQQCERDRQLTVLENETAAAE